MSDDVVDLRDFPYMPLHIARLQRSKAWLACKRDPALAFFMINLWMRAWHEVPAGSIEDDDDVLADAAMCDPKTWDRIKVKVLRGWQKQGGRLVHPVVTELAGASHEAKSKQRRRTSAATEARSQKRDEPRDEQRNVDRNVERDVDRDEQRNVGRDDCRNVERGVNVTSTKGREREEKGRKKEDSGSLRSPEPQAVSSPPDPPTMRDALWRDGVPILKRLIGQSDSQTRGFLGRLLKATRDDAAQVYRVIREADSLRPADPSAWLTAACRADRATAPPSKRMEAMAVMAGFELPIGGIGEPRTIEGDPADWRATL